MILSSCVFYAVRTYLWKISCQPSPPNQRVSLAKQTTSIAARIPIFLLLQDILKDNTLQDSAQQNDTGINSMDLRTEDDAIDTPYITTEERASLTKMIRDQAAKALTINRKYQKAALQQLQEVEKAYARNKALGAQLQALNDRQEAVERAPLILSTTKARLGPPYFVDRDGKTPPDNEDTIRRKKRPLIVTGKMRRWTDQERESLKAGVISENKRILFNEFTKAGNEAGIRSLQTAADIQMMLNTQGLNWSRISQRFVDTRTASECLIQWAGNDHPGINKAEWSSDEFAKLEDLVKKHQGHNWVQIALDLRTDRTGAQCFRQYQTKKMTKQISKEPWTEEEDGVLKEAVEMLGERSWQQVSYCFDNRSPAQCMERWKKSLNPSIRRGRWLEEEDGALRAALKVYGEGRWTKVAQHVLGRTDIQCRERYLNVLSPNLKMGPWTAEETELLANLVKEHGDKKWALISSHIEGRTDNHCSAPHFNKAFSCVRIHSCSGLKVKQKASVCRVVPKRCYGSILFKHAVFVTGCRRRWSEV
ncbi:hypothetical protein BC939DRAFT_77822 [Gamsiella multidivaricata]|uniref:uncharacterized protein n=1 Tax=Gamsiella multidivaricata TaxID=101098 RepID=UPI00221EF48A|nr:uncharacterized protein BC939DRAFT_77822 [Gamsiella multidivaricata]KAI7828030.1 hypothetical protein BC939DRAFT_77822 [Gamsiella multidivaricata]